jgi:hypothetical protein
MTGSITVGLVGATASTYSWARVSGATSIVANSPSAATTTFTASGVNSGATVSAVFRCTVNSTYTVDVVVDCTNAGAAISITVSPRYINVVSSLANVLTDEASTATASGGTGPYTYSWYPIVAPLSGVIYAYQPSEASTRFYAPSMSANEIRSATFRVTASDAPPSQATAYADVQVTVTRASMSVSLSPTSLYQLGTKSSITTGLCTATAANGVAPYTYAWLVVPGTGSGPSMVAVSDSYFATQFRCPSILSGQISTATWRCTATESIGAIGTADIVVTIQRV